MKKEYRFALLEYDEHARALHCPLCAKTLDPDEILARCPTEARQGLLWICAQCAVKIASCAGMPNVQFYNTKMLCEGNDKRIALETASANELMEVILR